LIIRVTISKYLEFIVKIIEIAPVYFVNGNNEWWSGKALEFEIKLKRRNVEILNNKKVILAKEESEIVIAGIDDPVAFQSKALYKNKLIELKDVNFSILLSHRPENFKLYVMNDFDLIFSGHAHGSQAQFPFLVDFIHQTRNFFQNIQKDL